ncbi:hypothetical protein ACLOJK_024407 [Asimina triloba]
MYGSALFRFPQICTSPQNVGSNASLVEGKIRKGDFPVADSSASLVGRGDLAVTEKGVKKESFWRDLMESVRKDVVGGEGR